jgi:uncharacterized phage protein (TIGR01671 family)
MREIKFRAWDLDDDEYISWHQLTHTRYNQDFLREHGDPKGAFLGFMTDKHIQLEQYTGLKDKNGREIYEGDIISFTVAWHDLGVVQFAKGIFGLNSDYKKSADPENKDGRLYGAWGQAHNLRRVEDGEILSEAEIIGNIHENPELLK